MSTTNAVLIERRTELLARVHLSRREDLLFAPAGEAIGLDLIACIDSAESIYRCLFGIILKGTSNSLLTVESASDLILHDANRRGHRGIRHPKFPFPVVFLVFSMKDDRGFYAWSTEPVIGQKAGPKLRINRTPACHLLGDTALDSIISRTTDWYEQLPQFSD